MDPDRFLRRRVDGLYVFNLKRLMWILREKYPKVLSADRRFEEETNYRNKIGTNNLVDALSHIGTLFASAAGTSFDEQNAQITLFEDHLRRTMMEAWELMVDFQTGEIDKLWYDEYLTIARPLQQDSSLHGHPSADHIDKLRKRYVDLLDEGRSFKRGLGWREWEAGTDKLIEACVTASELRETLHEAIKAAEGLLTRRSEQSLAEDDRDATAADRGATAADRSSTRRRDNLNKGLAVLAIVVALLLGLGLGSGLLSSTSKAKPTRTVTVHARSTTTTLSPGHSASQH